MTQTSQLDNTKKKLLFLWMTALLFSSFCVTPAWADSLEEQQLVEQAKHTVESFMDDPNLHLVPGSRQRSQSPCDYSSTIEGCLLLWRGWR